MAQYASTNRTALSYIAESVFGTDPGTAKQEIRYTGESLNFDISNITSDEIRSDRQTTDLVQVSAEAAGDINFELSYGSYDEFIEAALASTWSGITTAVTTANTTAGGGGTATIVAAGDEFDNVQVGQQVYVDDGTTTGIYKVTVVDSGTDTITVADPTNTIVTQTGGGTVKGSSIANGTTLHSFSIDKELRDANPVASFAFSGMRVGGMNLNVEVGSIVTGSFSFMGLDVATGGAITPAPTAPATTSVMNAVTNVTGLEIDDTASTACYNSFTMALNNALRGQDCIGNLGHSGVSMGRVDLTGNINIYFKDVSEYTKFKNGSSFSFEFTLTDAAGNSYTFNFPELKYESMTIVSGGLDADMMVDATWRAIMDPVLGVMVIITKIGA